MPRMPFIACLSILLSTPMTALTGPPEGVSGRMVLDEVAVGLRKYRAEKDPENRIKWLARLTPREDPRVIIVLGEALYDRSEKTSFHAALLLSRWADSPACGFAWVKTGAKEWWKANEADLRRQAKELP